MEKHFFPYSDKFWDVRPKWLEERTNKELPDEIDMEKLKKEMYIYAFRVWCRKEQWEEKKSM